jgi:hypothetical protein
MDWRVYIHIEYSDTLTRAPVVATGRDLIREIVAVPDDTMSFMEAANEVNFVVQT